MYTCFYAYNMQDENYHEHDNMNILLRAQNIVKHFNGRRVLDIDEMLVPCGERLSLVGGNGCGKTTLLKIIAGLLPADSAAAWHFHRSPLQRGRGGIMLAHQTPYMFSASVRANVSLGGGKNTEVQNALRWAGLSEFADFPARDLSGGLQQRVSLARLHAARPRLCLLDEPAAHLDAEGMKLVPSLADYLQNDNAAIIIAAPQNIFATHAGWQLHEGTLHPLSDSKSAAAPMQHIAQG